MTYSQSPPPTSTISPISSSDCYNPPPFSRMGSLSPEYPDPRSAHRSWLVGFSHRTAGRSSPTQRPTFCLSPVRLPSVNTTSRLRVSEIKTAQSLLRAIHGPSAAVTMPP